MRVIEARLGEVRAVAVSPDGRFVAASGEDAFGVFHWATGEPLLREEAREQCSQLVFAPHGSWVARGRPHLHLRLQAIDRGCLTEVLPSAFSGGVAVSPDNRTLVATSFGAANEAKLVRWTLPRLRSVTGFDFWSPFTRLAFSPDGQFLAGVWPHTCELRFAASGGLDSRHHSRVSGNRAANGFEHPPGFVSFDRHSGTCAFGWEGEFYVLDISTGTSKPGPRVEAQFGDAAFLPSGQHFATVGDDGFLKLWNPETWKVAREYDWSCGPLTALAFSADGSGGVCGTADGRLVQFDVDE